MLFLALSFPEADLIRDWCVLKSVSAKLDWFVEIQGEFWNARVSHSPKTPIKTDLCVKVLWENKSMNVLMRNHTHPHYEFGLLIPGCATYDHRKVSNPFSSSLSLCEEGQWVIVNGLRGEGNEVAKSYLLPWEKDNKREEVNTGTEVKEKSSKGRSDPDIAKSKYKWESQRVCLWYSCYLISTCLLFVSNLADWLALVHLDD